MPLTSNASKQLSCKALNLAVWKWHKRVCFQKVKHRLAQQIHNYADVTAEIEAIPQMYAAVAVLWIVQTQGLQHPQLDSRCVAVLLYRADHFDCNCFSWSLTVDRFYDFTECALAK